MLEAGEVNLPEHQEVLKQLSPFGAMLRYDSLEPEGLSISRETLVTVVVDTLNWAFAEIPGQA